MTEFRILTKDAMEITPEAPERQDGCARKKMIQRLLLNGIETDGTRSLVGLCIHLSQPVHTNPADAALILPQHAGPGAEGAFHPLIGP